MLWSFLKYAQVDPVGIYLFKVSNINTITRCEICSKLTIKTSERRHWRELAFKKFSIFYNNIFIENGTLNFNFFFFFFFSGNIFLKILSYFKMHSTLSEISNVHTQFFKQNVKMTFSVQPTNSPLKMSGVTIYFRCCKTSCIGVIGNRTTAKNLPTIPW